jgi:hypothetical protein
MFLLANPSAGTILQGFVNIQNTKIGFENSGQSYVLD